MRRIVLVGAGPGGRALARALQGTRRIQIVGLLDADPQLWGTTVEGVPVLGPSQALDRWLDATGASDVVIDGGNAGGVDLAPVCFERGLAVVGWATAYETFLKRVPIGGGGDASLEVLTVSRPNLPFRLVHRAIDLVTGLLGLLLTGLLAPLVAFGHHIESRGSLFYRQVRVGKGGRAFLLWKFRTMCADAEAMGPQWAREGDPRVTRMGSFLRRLHLDEVPQAWNLIRGDMSFIGPRPERPEFVGLLDTLPSYRARHMVRPGITGWAQVHYCYSDSIEKTREKLQYDLYYVKYRTVCLDFLILLKTLMLVLRRQGR